MTRPTPPATPADETVRAAVDFWRQDAAGTAAGIDPETVFQGALEAAHTAGRQDTLASEACRRYAAAALLLLGLSAGGSAWLLLRGTGAEPWGPSVVGAVEQERLQLQGTLEMLALPVARPREKGE